MHIFFNIDKQKQKHFDYFRMLVNSIRALRPGPVLSLQGPQVFLSFRSTDLENKKLGQDKSRYSKQFLSFQI